MNLAWNCWFSECYNTTIITAKLSHIILLTYYSTYGLEENNNKIAYGKVAYQRVRREMRLASDNSWTRHCLEHLWWRSRWIILRTRERRMAVSCEISRADRYLFGLSSWLSTRSSTATRCLQPDNCTRLAHSLQQTVDASKFTTLVGQFTQQPSCTILLWQIEIFNQNRKFLRNFHDFV